MITQIIKTDYTDSKQGKRGSMFLSSVLIMVIFLVLGLSFASISVSQTRLSSNLGTATDAFNYAQAGLDKAIWYSRFYPDTWRNMFTSGVWWTGVPLNRGTFEVAGTDTDGVLNDDPSDEVYFTAKGFSGNTVRVLSAKAEPRPKTVLTNVVFSSSTIDFKGSVGVHGKVRANGNLTSSGPFILKGDVFTAPGSSVESDIPDADTQVFYTASESVPNLDINYFTSRGQILNITSSLGVVNCKLCVLSPTSNPFGSLSAEGLYYIQANNNKVDISDVAVYGTLVILNATNLILSGAYHHERVNLHYPVIIMGQGNLNMDITRRLDEPSASIDYNQDGDMLDSFSSSINGVIYIPGTFNGPSEAAITGCVIAQSLILNGPGDILHDINLNSEQAIIGFLAGLDIVAGTYKEVY